MHDERKMTATLYHFLIWAGFVIGCQAAEDTVNNKPNSQHNSTNPMEFRLDLKSQSYIFQFQISITAPANVFGKDTDFKTFFNDELLKAFRGTKGFKQLEIISTSARDNVTCICKVQYNASMELSELKSSLTNIVKHKINSLTTIKGGTIYIFKLEKYDFQELINQGTFNQRSKCYHLVPSCPKEYVCVDTPYFICIHRCEYKNTKLSCNNGGHCFVDQSTNSTKCSCPSTDEYVYTGPICQEKVEKLKLESNYIIAIAAGGGGTIILILIVVIIVLCRRRPTVQENKEEFDETYELEPRVRYPDDWDRASNRDRNSKISLDGVSNGLYSGSVDIKFVDGRSHSVLKDSRGQEIYVYRPVSGRPVSANGDIGMPTSSRHSLHENLHADQRFEIERPHYRRDY